MKRLILAAVLAASAITARAETTAPQFELGFGVGSPYQSFVSVVAGLRIYSQFNLEARLGSNLKGGIYSLGGSWYPPLGWILAPLVGTQLMIVETDTGDASFHSTIHLGFEMAWDSGLAASLGVETYFRSIDPVNPFLVVKYRF